MSRDLSLAEIKLFEARVHHHFQQGTSKLRGKTRARTGVKARQVQFPVMGIGIAKQKAPQDDVTPMNVTHAPVTCTLQDWYASEYTDIFNNEAVNYDEREELAITIAGALGRRLDQIMIAAVGAIATFAGVVDVNVGGATTNLNVAKLTAAARVLDTKNVPAGDRYFVGHAKGKEALLNSTQLTSADYNSVKALVNGEINSFMGFEFIWFGDLDEGGLTIATNVREGFAFHKNALGQAIGAEVGAKVDWSTDKLAWHTHGIIMAGGVAIDPTRGVVRVQSQET